MRRKIFAGNIFGTATLFLLILSFNNTFTELAFDLKLSISIFICVALSGVYLKLVPLYESAAKSYKKILINNAEKLSGSDKLAYVYKYHKASYTQGLLVNLISYFRLFGMTVPSLLPFMLIVYNQQVLHEMAKTIPLDPFLICPAGAVLSFFCFSLLEVKNIKAQAAWEIANGA